MDTQENIRRIRASLRKLPEAEPLMDDLTCVIRPHELGDGRELLVNTLVYPDKGTPSRLELAQHFGLTEGAHSVSIVVDGSQPEPSLYMGLHTDGYPDSVLYPLVLSERVYFEEIYFTVPDSPQEIFARIGGGDLAVDVHRWEPTPAPISLEE